jgi:hypothetical protein
MAPLTAPADASLMKADRSMASMQGDMPCCPPKAAMPDCGGKATCPVISICFVKYFEVGPVAAFSPATHAAVEARLHLRDDDQWASLSPSPPARPPRS